MSANPNQEIKMNHTPKLIAVLTVLLLTVLACSRTIPTTSSSSPNTAVGETTHHLTHDERDRSYILYIPATVKLNEPVPLVFVFHGGTGNAQSAIHMSGFNEIADEFGFIVVYPNGAGRLSDDKLLTWNGGACCGYAQEKNVDDVGFVRAIVDDLQSQITLDEKRIYATGLSNGGILSHRLGCEATDLFAAIAPVAGTLNFAPCNPAQPISVIEFHGTADQHILYEGGFGPDSLVDVDFASVADSVAFWTSFNACAPQPQTNMFEDIQDEIWTGCSNSTNVELVTIMDGGHSWPGGQSGWPGSDQPTTTISAAQLIWEFFADHPKP